MWVRIFRWTFIYPYSFFQELPKRISTAEEKEILSLLCRVHELEIDKVSKPQLPYQIQQKNLIPKPKTCCAMENDISQRETLLSSLTTNFFLNMFCECRWRWRVKLSWRSTRWGDEISWFWNMTNKDLCAMKSSSASRNSLKVKSNICNLTHVWNSNI